MMNEAAAEANIRFANTDIVPTPDKGAGGSVDNEFGKGACRRHATDRFSIPPQIGRERRGPIFKDT
jgi:hypothetical protein